MRSGCFDRVARIYDATRGLPPEAEAGMADALAGALRRAGPAPRLLEVGVGTGRIALPLAQRGCRVVGVDLSAQMLAQLRRKPGAASLRPARGSAGDLPFRDDAFDAALFVHVLHLVPDPARAIREALRVVRSGGVVAFAGEDLWQSELLREARRLMREAILEATGLELGGHAGHLKVLERIAAEMEAAHAPLERIPLARWETRITGRELLRGLERKDMSWMWPLPDARVPAVLERLRPRLLALCGGDLDRSHAVERSMSALVARCSSLRAPRPIRRERIQ